MGRARGTNGREERCRQGFGGGDLRERDDFEHLGIDGRLNGRCTHFKVIDGRIILKWIFKKWDRETWTRLVLVSVGAGGGLL
jgi:hypothetical protein